MLLRIARAHWELMRAHVAAEAPQEACGLLAGTAGRGRQVFAIPNELASTTHFSMAPGEQLRAFMDIEVAGWELLAIYHSHPGGPPHPSQTDVAEARYPGVVHLIWSPHNGEWDCRAFLLDGGEVKQIELVVEVD